MINVALCAYGMSGKVFHAPLIFAEPNMVLHTVLQRNKKTAQEDFPSIEVAGSFEQIIRNPQVHLVVINTPNDLHYPMAKAALEAGKHVVVEKPFTLTIAEGEELIALAQKKKSVIAVFQNKRLESDFLDTQAIIQSEKLGRIVEVEWHYDRYRTHVTHKRWKEDKLPGSGTWFDLGIHMVDSMLSLFGIPEAVTADMRSLRRADGAVDYFNVGFHYPDMRVLLRSNTFVSEKGPTVTIHGDKGSFLKFGEDVQESQLQQGIRPGMPAWAKPDADNFYVLHVHKGDHSFRETHAGASGCYGKFYRNIAEAITTPEQHNEILQFHPAQSLLGVKLLLLAEQSHALAKTLYL